MSSNPTQRGSQAGQQPEPKSLDINPEHPTRIPRSAHGMHACFVSDPFPVSDALQQVRAARRERIQRKHSRSFGDLWILVLLGLTVFVWLRVLLGAFGVAPLF